MDSVELSNHEQWILVEHRFRKLKDWALAGSHSTAISERKRTCYSFLEALSLFMDADIEMEVK